MVRLNGNLPSGVPRESNGGVPVNLQDQTTRPVFVKFNAVQNSTTLSALAVKGARTITVASTTGFIDKRYIILFDPLSLSFSFFNQVGAPVGNVITLDAPLDYAYPIGTNVEAAITNMAVDGSTPMVFGLRGLGSPPGVDLSVDVTNIFLQCITTSAADLDLFGDIAALTNGVLIRKRDDICWNILNMKKNSEIPGINITSAINPAQGVDGFLAEIKLAGQENAGVAIRLPIGDDLEIMIQDDIDAITSLEAYAIMHILSN